ncbi:MAG: DUF1684 domain-containing protein [Saprospiraceae bacterium]|nr:DUF1684 domain-containing protein [Saprospiraceae bacterium]
MKHLPSLLLLFMAQTLGAQTTDSTYTAQMAHHRQAYKEHFLTESRSPLMEDDTAFLDFFAPDASWRVNATFERTFDTEPFDMPTYSGRSARYQQYGIFTFEKDGKKHTLRVYQNLRLLNSQKYFDYLFLPFKDHSNGDSTYGGGRYLDLKTGDIGTDNTMSIDFNKCYNPWCAYSDGFNCPIPPKENHLDIMVDAGEKNFRGERKH